MTWLMGNFPTNRGLVGISGFNPSEKYSSNGISVPNMWKNIKLQNVHNHQPS
jgi:hypothetical protein